MVEGPFAVRGMDLLPLGSGLPFEGYELLNVARKKSCWLGVSGVRGREYCSSAEVVLWRGICDCFS